MEREGKFYNRLARLLDLSKIVGEMQKTRKIEEYVGKSTSCRKVSTKKIIQSVSARHRKGALE